jgi:hypothetical protein
MHNFKIIAIRTGNMDPTKVRRGRGSLKLDPLRNLQKNQTYVLRREYKFPEEDLRLVEYLPESDIELYTLNTSINNIPVNINAIVGSNGSGKSTLIELLYWANYNLGASLDLLETDGNKRRPHGFLDFEMLYSINEETLIKVTFREGKILRQNYKKEKNKFLLFGNPKEIRSIYDLTDFFYTIVINYSHYALNSHEIGDWIEPLFHKNDAYQTPIVLNPMRTAGDININKEKHLLTRRLIANILEPVSVGQEENSLRSIVNGKIAHEFEITYNPNPNSNLEEPVPSAIREKLIIAIEEYFKFRITDKQLDNDFFVNVTLSYIYKKMIKMVEYKMFRRYRNQQSKNPDIKDINAFMRRIHKSNSHIAFKVKGAILYLKYYKSVLPGNFLNLKEPFKVSVKEFSDAIVKISDSEKDFVVNTYMMSPPSYFYVDIIPKDKGPFSALSSGEKQRIHSVSSIVYHLINLNSVEELKEASKYEYEDQIHYNYINVVLDEIELYYHPNWQRTYIADLLDYIGKVNPKSLQHIRGINITFLTHSPYILSDIPDTFVLRLIDGKVDEPKEGESTFGSNIHDLLANDFFMHDAFMGEWARRQIEETIRYLNLKQCEKRIYQLNEKKKPSTKNKIIYEGNDQREEDKVNLENLIKERDFLRRQPFRKDENYYKKLVELIGEPVIRNKIKSMFSELLEEKDRIKLAKEKIRQMADDEGIDINFN